jgi:hypothetical protein
VVEYALISVFILNSDGRMKNVWETCTFSDEIVSGDLKLYKFAVELHEFLDEQADSAYQDPELFFENTFLTSQMKLILRDSLLRLSKGSGTPVTVIDTGFGGGKTHTILLLYHIYNNRDLGSMPPCFYTSYF